MARIRAVVAAFRPADPEFAAALARRWAELPETARTPGQLLGRHAVGCEGTHGVFPKCNLACTPCYHSRDANQVRVDGPHTLARVQAQMALLREQRGPRAHAQLIGGEVTLLDPDDHAAALAIMRDHGREPMSFMLGPGGRRRLRRVSFAAHFDSLMFGRRGIPRPPDEASLNPYRERFAAMFTRLRSEHKVRYFLAHNMTVTPANLGQVAAVVRDCAAMGYGMFSFQPAAFVGDQRRWHEDYQQVTGDQVWAQIERGAGTRLDYRVLEHGDVRCNRAAYGFWAGDRWYPLLDGGDRRDVAVRDAFFRYFGPVNFTGTPVAALAVKIAGAAGQLCDAPVHGRRRRHARMGADAARPGQRRPADPRYPGTAGRLPLRDGPPGKRHPGAGLRAAQRARPGRKPRTSCAPADPGGPAPPGRAGRRGHRLTARGDGAAPWPQGEGRQGCELASSPGREPKPGPGWTGR